jgi:hypothetical protein
LLTWCMECNQNKKATVSARHPMLSYHSGSPMERVHLDFIGPLPRTKRGNKHILMMVDQFTKWVKCIPLPSQGAEETTRAAVNQFFSIFGCPFQVFTDQSGFRSSTRLLGRTFMLFCLKKGTAVFNDTSVFFLSFHYFKVLYFNYNCKDSVE